LSSSGNVARRFNPMNAVLILYQSTLCTLNRPGFSRDSFR